AARALLRRLVVLEREDEFAIVTNPLVDGEHGFLDALELHEAGDLAHQRALGRKRAPRARRAGETHGACPRSGAARRRRRRCLTPRLSAGWQPPRPPRSWRRTAHRAHADTRSETPSRTSRASLPNDRGSRARACCP